MRTVADHIGMMRHAIGKSPASGHDLYQTFQDAGNQLLQLGWAWSKRTVTALAFVAGQDQFELPDDFGRVVTLTPDGTMGVEQMTRQQMAALRVSGQVGFANLSIALCFDSARRQRTPAEPSRMVGEIWPTPTATGSPVVAMEYLRTFPRYTEDRGNEYPDIDEQADFLLSLMAQDAAYLVENKRRLFDPAVIAEETARVKGLDGSRQWYHGQMSGGALDRLPPQDAAVPVSTITVT